MADLHKVRCSKCGHTVERQLGIDIMGQGTLYCDRCGASKRIDLSNGWEPIDSCSCGGSFDAASLGRCPNCNSLLPKIH